MYHVLFFFLSILILAIGSCARGKTSSIVFIGFFVFISIYAGLRGDVGQDTLNYQVIYNEMDVSDFYSNFIFEPVFVLIFYIHKVLFDNLTFLFVFVSALQSIILYYASRNLAHRWVFVFVYVLTFYLNFYFNVIRVGLALNFFLLSLSVRKSRPSYIFLCLAVLTHLSILAVVPFYIVRRANRISSMVWISVLGLLFFFMIWFFLGDYIHSKMVGYEIIGASGFGLSFGSIFFLVLGFLLLVFPFRSSFKALCYCSIFMLVFYFSNFIDILYRVRHLAFCVLVFLMLEERVFNLVTLRFKSSIVWVLVLVLWTGQQQWAGYLGERAAVASSGRGHADFTYIPYEPYFDSDYRK